MRRLWLGLLLCACSGSSDNEVDGSVLGFSLTARDALYFVHNNRQLVVISDQDNTCRKLTRQTVSGEIHLLELYLWNLSSTDPTSLVEGTYEVADDNTSSLESQGYFGAASGCDTLSTRWFRAGSGRVILLNAGLPAPGERSQVAFRLGFGDEVLSGHADAAYCDLPATGPIGCINEGTTDPPTP
jgi:hypothetical protein